MPYKDINQARASSRRSWAKVEVITKVCPDCNKVRSSKKWFFKRKICQTCYWPYKREYHLRSKYDMSLDDYNKMLLDQEKKCAICLTETKLVIDHCHKTNKIRGLLCRNCNVSLGLLKDNIKTLNNALLYLTK